MPERTAVDGFAEMLRELKDRSGRSYEALARRAGISGSAVHRYCSGQTVPTEFDVVERLARLCGASRDEALELHGRWAVAAATRDAVPAAARSTGSDAAGAVDSARVADVPPAGIAVAPAGVQRQSMVADASADPDAVRRRRRIRCWSAAAVATVLAVIVPGAVMLGGPSGRPTDGPVDRPAGRVPATAAPSDNPYGDRILFSPTCAEPVRMGEHDACVGELQRLLIAAGARMAQDSDFGPDTLRKVTAYQMLAGLNANGVVDDDMKTALYGGTVRMPRWSEDAVAARIRGVFREAPERAVRVARCQSFLDPLWVLPNTNGTRNWGVFQLSDTLLHRYGGTPTQALDLDWNIQTAHRAWAEHHDFRPWPNCAAT
jgi:Helix-turn-helix domain/Putative peptidoglycan binding domain